MDHMQYLTEVSNQDLEVLREKERTYKGSWKKRGGVGAFMMLARKWDRIESIVQDFDWDIFFGCTHNMSGDDGTMLAEVRDLRRYLLLVESEIIAQQKHVHIDGTPKEDSNRHATDAFIHTGNGLGGSEDTPNDPGQYVGLDRSGD